MTNIELNALSDHDLLIEIHTTVTGIKADCENCKKETRKNSDDILVIKTQAGAISAFTAIVVSAIIALVSAFLKGHR